MWCRETGCGFESRALRCRSRYASRHNVAEALNGSPFTATRFSYGSGRFTQIDAGTMRAGRHHIGHFSRSSAPYTAPFHYACGGRTGRHLRVAWRRLPSSRRQFFRSARVAKHGPDVGPSLRRAVTNGGAPDRRDTTQTWRPVGDTLPEGGQFGVRFGNGWPRTKPSAKELVEVSVGVVGALL